MPQYNGHKNYNFWNVSLWMNNDEDLYNLAKESIKVSSNRDEAARYMLQQLTESGQTLTPDGAPYTVSAIRAAMREL